MHARSLENPLPVILRMLAVTWHSICVGVIVFCACAMTCISFIGMKRHANLFDQIFYKCIYCFALHKLNTQFTVYICIYIRTNNILWWNTLEMNKAGEEITALSMTSKSLMNVMDAAVIIAFSRHANPPAPSSLLPTQLRQQKPIRVAWSRICLSCVCSGAIEWFLLGHYFAVLFILIWHLLSSHTYPAPAAS